jgi:D-3-phosphoglycerate dehydrogenase / 2-oxoglutarate reductase
MRVKFECPTDFISSEIFEGLIEDNESPECIILNPGSDIFYDKRYFDSFVDLKIVGTPSTGVNHIDRKYLEQRKIKLYSLLDDRESLDGITASAEFTWLHIMNAVRKFSTSLKFVYKWRDLGNENFLRSIELSDKKLGIIGFGRIGRKLNKYAQAFEMNVKFYDPYVEGSCESIEDLYDVDVLSINCYLNDETKGMVSNNFFSGFKKGLIVINTSRGEVVDEEYVAQTIISGDIFYSCDVLSNEQDISKLHNSPLYSMYQNNNPNLVITPHVAGVTIDSQRKAMEIILKLCMK